MPVPRAASPQNPAILRRLLGETLRFPVRTSVALASVAGLALAQLYLTWLVKQWLEGPLATGDSTAVRALLVRGTGVVAFGVVALFFSRYLVSSVDQTVVERLRNRAVERLLRLEPAQARAYPTGDVLARLMTDASTIAGLLAGMRRLIREAIVVSGASVMLFVLEWRLALAACVVAPIAVALLVRVGTVIRRTGHAAQVAVGSLGSILNEVLHGFATVKGYQTERFELERFAARNAHLRRHALRAELWAVCLICVVSLLTGLGIVATLLYGTSLLSRGHLAPATLVTFLLFASQIVEPLRRLSDLHGGMQTAAAAAGRLYELVDLPRADPNPGAPLAQPVRGGITFENVSFGYDEDTRVLAGVSLTLAAHEHVALVGATGGGKTTLARLLVRFAEPGSGRVLLDGQDVRGVDLSSLRRAVTLVEQDPFLFSGPLVDNIRYGTWDAPPAAIHRAVRLAGLEALVARLPAGLETVLGEAGAPLSGGERQRVSLARAIVRNPAVLVLDEATSALDGETEVEVFSRLAPWLAERTVIAIAHRFSTVRRFPRAIVLHAGTVAGDGPIAALVDGCPTFVSLFADQITATHPARFH